MIALVKFLIVLCFLLYACVLDIRERIVPNRVWKYMLLASLPFTALELTSADISVLALSVVTSALTAVLAYAIYLIGAYGGADAKAIMCLAAIFPVYPSFWIFPLLGYGFSFAFATLANAVVAAPVLMMLMFVRNVAKEGFANFRRYPLYYFVGYRVRVTEIPKFHNLLEVVENGKLKRLRRGLEPTEEHIGDLKRAGIEMVWVTPALPFVVFITAGYVAAFFVGDLIFYAMLLVRSS
ncbi:MAG: A24 family peptidase C-terminal domain-containing protein [Archaeoglobaceae archaeon]